MARRDSISQMPPLGSRVVDREAVALVERWIDEGLLQPHDPEPVNPQSATKEEN